MGKRQVLEGVHNALEGIISAANGDSLRLQERIHAVRDQLTRHVPKLLITSAWNPYALLLDVPFLGKDEFAYFEGELRSAESALQRLKQAGKQTNFISAINKVRALALEQMTYESLMQPSRQWFINTPNEELLAMKSNQYMPANPILQGIIIAAARRVVKNASELPCYYTLELKQWESAAEKGKETYPTRL